jgi:RNA polymerase sigma factor (sigma-70 family)
MALREARRAAQRAHKQCNGLIDYDELVSFGYEWIAKHPQQAVEWCDKDAHPGGWKALGKSMLRYMNRQVSKERAYRNGGSTSDQFYYSPGLIAEILPDIWDEHDRTPGGQAPSDTPRGKSMPSEGMNREAAMADVLKAVGRLADEETKLLQARFYANLTLPEIAKMYGVSEDTVSRRLANTIRTVGDLLGGEQPWKTKRRSNAAAQAETRSGYEEGVE